MAIIASDSGGGSSDFSIVPEGVHQAVCDMMVDLGVQKTTFEGKESEKHQVYIRWQVPEERVKYTKDGVEMEGPMVIGRKYTLSLDHRSSLRRDLASWRCRDFTDEEVKGFDITKVLGVNCQLQVQHRKGDKHTFANIQAIMALPKGCASIPLEGDPVLYDSENLESFGSLPEWLQECVLAQINMPVHPGSKGGAPVDPPDVHSPAAEPDPFMDRTQSENSDPPF